MSHELDFSTGTAAIALRGGSRTAWHGLGQEILPGDSLKVIQRKAGLDWTVMAAPATYVDDRGHEHKIPNTVVNFRSDTKAPLGVVSANKYSMEGRQPGDILGFFRDLLKDNGMSIETAGALRGGRIVWALAKLGPDYDFLMPGKDKVSGYFRLQTGNDGDNATTGVYTTIRQVCANTMRAIDHAEAGNIYSVSHSQEFNAKAFKAALGFMGEQHKVTAEFWNALCARKVSDAERQKFFCDLFRRDVAELNKVDAKGKPVIPARTRNMLAQLESAYANGPGADMKSAKGTAFGLLQAVTYWCDHKAAAVDKYEAGESSARLTSAWFGLGEETKQDAQYLCAEMAGCLELIGEKVAA